MKSNLQILYAVFLPDKIAIFSLAFAIDNWISLNDEKRRRKWWQQRPLVVAWSTRRRRFHTCGRAASGFDTWREVCFIKDAPFFFSSTVILSLFVWQNEFVRATFLFKYFIFPIQKRHSRPSRVACLCALSTITDLKRPKIYVFRGNCTRSSSLISMHPTINAAHLDEASSSSSSSSRPLDSSSGSSLSRSWFWMLASGSGAYMLGSLLCRGRFMACKAKRELE